MNIMKSITAAALVTILAGGAVAQQPTLEIDVTGGVIEPVPFADPVFIAENGAAGPVATQITQVVASDLAGTGLFRELPQNAYISGVSNFNAPVQFADWRAINAQALVIGAASVTNGKLTVKFRLFDVFAQAPIGEGVQFSGRSDDWRRMAHKVADTVYSRLTGETGYFDSQVVYVAESGPKDNRRKRLAVMDYDGANVRYLTADDTTLVLSPRFSPDNSRILYTSYETGEPKIYMMDVATGQRQRFDGLQGTSFAPRWSPDGTKVVLSQTNRGNTDIYTLDVRTGQEVRLTSGPAIDTAPSYSPDGSKIVFESDRGGSQQLYVMSANGGDAKRISFGTGRYATPVWSPRGDLVAFTKMEGGRFHIGVMRLDGTQERLLSASFLDEGPTWSPNGRVLMFFRESSGSNGTSQIYAVDVTGRNLRKVPTPGAASDPAWSGLLN